MKPLIINQSRYAGRELLDFFEYHIRQAAKNKEIGDDFSTDLIWYCWRGAVSPLFGKDKMTTLERYFIEDKDTHKEVENHIFLIGLLRKSASLFWKNLDYSLKSLEWSMAILQLRL